MSRYLDTEEDELPRRSNRVESSPDREINLNTGAILGIFIALAILCAVFFGFGYSTGKKSVVGNQAVNPAASASSTSDPNETGKAERAAADDQAADTPSAETEKTSKHETATGEAAISAHKPSANSATLPAPAAAKPTLTATGTTSPRPVVPVIKPAIPTAPMPATTAAGPGTTMVQIAAVSHPQDAEMLMTALKRRGYSVFTRKDNTDDFIHIQVGPYATKKDAEVMRQKLLSDGYNAILK